MRRQVPFALFASMVACGVGLVMLDGRAQAQTQAQGGAGDDDASANAARSQYNAGTKAFTEQRYAEAALAFEAAAEDKPSAIALYTAALSWDKTNAPDRAADDYARALALPGLPPDKGAQAKDRLAVLESMLGSLAVSGVDGTHVQLDANSERSAPATLHGSAGVHTLMVRASGGPIERRQVVLERGKATSLDLATAPAPAVQPPIPAPATPPAEDRTGSPSQHPDWKTIAGVAAVGVGGATLLAGVLLGLEAQGAKNAYTAAPAHATLDHASQLQMWTNVAFIAGGVFTAGGLALVLWPSPHPASEPPKAEACLTPGGVVVGGAF